MLAENIHYLRRANGLSQQQLAELLAIPRTTLGDYERGKTEPNVEMLVRLAGIFKVSVDDLICRSTAELTQEIARGENLRVLAISLDSEHHQNIELVQSKAAAGYLENCHRPEFIGELPKISLPQLQEGSYRAFEVEGDSMLPMTSGSLVMCAYVESLKDVKDGQTYVVVTADSLVFKRLRHGGAENTFMACSDNPVYSPYPVRWQDIRELWKCIAFLSFTDPVRNMQHWHEESLTSLHDKLDRLLSDGNLSGSRLKNN